MVQINKIEIDTVIGMSKEERYDYFIKKTADFGLVWGLYSDGWALAGDEDKNIIIPFWPAKEYAQLCARDQWEEYTTESIEIHNFIGLYLDELRTNKILPGIFYTPGDTGIITSYDRIKCDIERELERIE